MAAAATGQRDAPPNGRRIDNEVEEIYGLSPTQRGMLLHTVWDPDATLFFQQLVLRLEDPDIAPLLTAWQRVVDRHPVLRSSFHWEDLKTPLQVVHRKVQLPIERLDWRSLPPAAHEERLRGFLRADRRRGFNLTEAPLMRLTLIRMGDRQYALVKSNHHMLLDAWSGATVLKEVHAVYQALRGGREPRLEEPVPYREYVLWLERQDHAAAEAFWRAELAGLTEPTPLPGERAPGPPRRSTARFLSHRVTVSGSSTAALVALAQRLQVTLSTLVQGAWAVLLSVWSGQQDVVFGATVSGRPAELEGVESMVGLFINALPVRVRVDPAQPTDAWLRALHAQSLRTQPHDHTPPAQVQAWSDVPRGAPLFETLVTFNSQSITFGTSRHRQRDRIPVERAAAREQAHPDPTNQPLSLVVVEAGDGLFVDVTADANRFDTGTPIRLLAQLRAVLEQFAAGSAPTVGDLTLMESAERQQVVRDWNRTRIDHPRHLCMHELFEATARRTPDATAVLMDGQSVSYDALNRRANRLAHLLRERGVGPEVLVGLAVERSPEMAVAVLAVLKAGGGYVPLDPEYPQARRSLMLEDSGAQLVLTQARFAGAWDGMDIATLCVDADADQWRGHPTEDPEPTARPENVAFVMYTSGSTGTPKGAAVPHRVCVSRVHGEADPFRPGDVLAAKTSLSFIDSVWEMLGAWAHGLPAAFIAPDRMREAASVIDALADAHATRIVLVPSLLRMLLESGEPVAERLPELEHWISSGEPLPRDLSERFAAQLPGRVLTNLYGTSETWDATRCDSRERRAEDGLPIGRPIANCTVYVLDARLRPLPVGVPGELYVGGEMLARGYHRRPALTAERFVPDPFSETPGARLYRTGDRVRWLADGNLESVGRVDQQLKIRGYRVEPGEVEVALRGHPAVRQAVVTATPQQQLMAHVVLEDAQTPEPDELRAHLRRRLPEHMVPVAFAPLDSLPLTPSGKVDRRALARRAATPRHRGRFIAPRTSEEAVVSEIFAGVLGVDRVGVEDDFFDLGGHSLLATQLLARLRSKLGVTVPIAVLFGSPTVASLAAWIDANRATAAVDAAPPLLAAAPAPGGREAPQSFAQQRMWFLAQLAPGSALYSTLGAVPLEGPLDRGALQSALDALVERHEALRTTFDTAADGELVQIVAPPEPVMLSDADLSRTPPDRRHDELQRLWRTLTGRPFDLVRGPLVRFTLARISPQRHVLAWTMHHIVTDGWSMGIIRRELVALYDAFRAGRPSPLPDLPVQYADFAAWQREWLAGEQLDAQLAYWTDALRSAPHLELPTDRPRPATPRYAAARVPIRIRPELADSLSELGRQEESTRFMVLLSAFQFLLGTYASQDDVVVGTPIANRTRSDLEGVVGFFVNTLVIRTRLAGAATFRQLLGQVRQTCLDAYAHQDLPFERLVEELAPQRDLGLQPLVQALFVLQNTPQGADAATAAPPVDAAGLIYFDLTLSLTDGPDGIAGDLHYNTDLFDRSTAEGLSRQLETLLATVAAAPDAPLSPGSMISDAEQARLSRRLAARTPAPDGCVHELIAAQAARAPDHLAVVTGSAQLTYGRLDRRATALAHRLRAAGVRPEVTAAAFFERGADAVVALLAILKAGGVYLALDPALPAERLAWQLADAEAAVVLTDTTLRPGLPASDALVLLVDEADDSAAAFEPPGGVEPRDAAYLVYTSGTTGRPKGVVVEHRGLFHTIRAQVPLFGLTPDSRVLATIAPGFDASLGEVLRALAAGATLHIAATEDVLPGPELLELLRTQRITTVTLSTSVLAALPDSADLPDLTTLTVGGEALPAEVAARWSEGRCLLNGYGPTETTIGATLATGWEPDRRPPIGFPLQHVRACVLDPAFRLLPEGVPGELFLGGPGVARGYRGRPDLTAERFVPDPFGGEPGSRLYRTGDRVRWLPDGQLEFQGRVDQQVKVRGHRVEPGEIAAVLRRHARVRDAAVVARTENGGDPRLVAYTVPAQAPAADDPTAAALVDEWERASEQAAVAVQEADGGDPALNFSGWTSSYTGRPIPPDEMRQWADSTVERLMELEPHDVLEVGSGTGLILFRLAPHCRRYVGVDFAAGLLDHAQRHLDRVRDSGCEVELHRRRADELDDWPPGTFDCVVLNSVVQYFPDVDYLLRVLHSAVRLTRAGGHVFIGDVRNLRLLGALHASVQLSRAAATDPAVRVAERVRRRRALERELVIDPALFGQLERASDRITHVRVLPKTGIARNELIAFRYDVVLQIEGDGPVEPAGPAKPWDWESAEAGLLAAQALLADGRDGLWLRGVPNARTAAEARLAAAIDSEDVAGTVGELRRERAPSDDGVEPDALVALGRELGYDVELSWLDCDAEGSYDAYFGPAGQAQVVRFGGDPPASRPWTEYANSPVEAAGTRNVRADLRQHLAERLPEYMVPSAIVLLPALPLTSHGKLDEAALPAADADADRAVSADRYVAPRTPAQKLLADIWADLLRLERVGVHDNFFELGGDSILSVRVIARANQAGLNLTTQEVYRLQTIAEQAAAAESAGVVATEDGPVTGDVPLTPIQRWFFEGDMPEPQHCNWATVLPVPPGLCGDDVRPAVTALLEHHDALRLRFVRERSGWRQFLADAGGEEPITVHDVAGLSLPERKAAIERTVAGLQGTLDLADGPLLRVAVFDAGRDGGGHLAVIVHHLVVDTLSWGTLIGDLGTMLRQLSGGRSITLPAKTSSFKSWAEHLAEYARSDAAADERRYWVDALGEAPAPVPLDHPGGENSRASAQELVTEVDDDDVMRLRGLASATRSGVDEVLLAAFAMTFARWTGAPHVRLDLEGHGRHDLGARLNLARTVGWFACIVPVALDVAADDAPREVLEAVRARWRAIPNRGIGHGLLRYLGEDAVRAELAGLPDAEVFLCYHGERRTPAEGGGVRALDLGPLQSPAGSRRYVVEINAVIQNGRLVVRWSYSANLHERETIADLAGEFEAALNALLAREAPRELTALRDCGVTGVALDDDELATLLRQLGGDHAAGRLATAPQPD